MNYLIHILVIFEIYLILSLAMNLLAGYSGMLSFTQAAFYGIGAYVTALLMIDLNLSFSSALVFAVVFNMVASLPVVLFSIRLRNLFFALATLAWQIIVFTVLYNWFNVTNGPFGISGIPKPEILGLSFIALSDFALLGGVFALIVLLFFTGLHRTPLSRLFEAVRDDELAVMTFGKNPVHFKTLAIVISSGISAIAGALFATYYGYIDPTSFSLSESILIISIVLIGGLGSVKGSITGSLFYVLLPEVLRFINMPDAAADNMRMMIFSLVLILVVRYRPHGFFGVYKFE